MKMNIRILLAGLLTTAMIIAPAVGIAQDKPKAAPESKAEDNPSTDVRSLPFRGTVAAVDKAAMTVTVGERVFHVTPETKVTRTGQQATLADVKVGDAITGSYVKADDGKLTAKTIRFGPKPEPAEKPPKKADAAEKK